MNRQKSFRIGLMLLGGLGLSALKWHASSQAISASPPPRQTPDLASPPISTGQVQAFDHLPLAFEVNHGQTDRQVQFLAHQGNSTLFLTPTAAVFRLQGQPGFVHQNRTHLSSLCETRTKTPREAGHSWALRMELVGANPQAQPHPEASLSGRVNYLLGNDPRQWHTNIPLYGRARYTQIYPGVDVIYYGQNQQLEYDFLVAPKADPSQIGLQFAGASRIKLDKTGALVVQEPGGRLQWKQPRVYQERGAGKQRLVFCRYVLRREHSKTPIVRLALGNYDRSRTLVIDPILVYSTYLGGSGPDYTGGFGVDSAGKAYLAGYTVSTNFPTTTGAFQTTNKAANHGYNAYLTKLKSDGTGLLYSTYFGGTGGEQAYALVLDRTGNPYLAGYTISTDFPTTPGAFQTINKAAANHSSNAFVAKFAFASFDFNHDGHPDIVFQNQTTNQVAVWYLNGLTYSGGGLTSLTPASGWKVVAVADMNGDGHPDLVFQNQTTNQAVIWYLNGLTYAGSAATSTTPTAGWKIVGPR